MVKFPWSKKPWDKVACNFTLQEYSATVGEKGWITISEPAGVPLTIEECREMFKPGRHYRVIARAVEEREGFKAGTYIGVVWKFYEPLPGGVATVKEKPKSAERTKHVEPEEVIGEYIEKFDRMVKPIALLSDSLASLRESLFGSQPEQVVVQQAGGEVTPLEYEGKAPWMLHPTVIKTIGEEVKEIIRYGTERLEQVMRGGVPSEAAEEAEEPLLPSMEDYVEKLEEEEEVAEEEVEEEAVEEAIPPEEPTEEAVSEIPEIEEPTPIEERVEEPLTPIEELEEIEKPTEEGSNEIPSLIEKEEVEEPPKKKRRKKKEES